MACPAGLQGAVTTEFVCKENHLSVRRTDADAGAVSGWCEGQLGDGMVSSRSSAAKCH
jgi:hypothetical protein